MFDGTAPHCSGEDEGDTEISGGPHAVVRDRDSDDCSPDWLGSEEEADSGWGCAPDRPGLHKKGEDCAGEYEIEEEDRTSGVELGKEMRDRVPVEQ